jgi:3-oxocholest-4-en-26-oyl-CoA dehydrogenase beta subunit
MDFEYSEEQAAVRELAGRIFADRSTHERLKEVEAAGGDDGPFDRELWSALAEAGLLGIGVGEDVGGAGLDFVAPCLVAEAAGRTAAAVPVGETLVAAGTIDRFGTDEQRRSWLPRIAAGGVVATVATAELFGDVVVPAATAPATTAKPAPAGGWRLEGTKACVPWGPHADLVLVPATVDDGVGVFLVEVGAQGVACAPQQTTTGRPEAIVRLEGVNVTEDALLGGTAADGSAVLASLVEHATAALCVEQAGVCAAALELTAEYAKTREQFDKPIATFQAVGQRAADAYVDTEAIRLTAWQAAWRLSAGLPAATEVATAKYWASEGGQRVVHAASHLHGGVGVDRDYPLHRYFLRARVIEHTLGDAGESLRRLGGLLASEPA